MIIRLFLALILLIGLMWLVAWLGKATPAQRTKAFKLILLYGFAAVILLLVVTGRIPWLFALLGAAVPWLQRALLARQAWGVFKSMQPPPKGQTSNVETVFLRMTLDHDTGDLDGEVLKGRFEGHRLSQMGEQDILQLLGECRHTDPQSVPLLEAFLDRQFGDQWRASDPSGDENMAHPSAKMTPDEARNVLGLDENPTRDEIIAAHRRLMQKLHPDRAGSTYLASLVNKAKDILLGD